MKKHLTWFIVGLVLLLIGGICLNIELKNYQKSSYLTSNFVFEQKEFDYRIEPNKKYKITNNKSNNNINLYFDNSLQDNIKIVIVYANLLDINSKYEEYKAGASINLESDLELDLTAIKEIKKLGIASLNNKTIYNYTLLKYPKINVYVNEKYKDNIVFADKYGKEYNPSK